ncbi:hypothetical protein AVEN_41807-1 [Araneus ventricosus]|uniref:Uncharacterized protein n=1 Tax=Araneus ventricosus TaxID=182803 RepID=A0A4Y2ADV0_ARAVE|nr:hypothetical protein AVEN_41807-1 [Araneus ventricosus]
MEVNKISQPEISAGKMITDDSSKTESCNSYCPDFSDMYDDSYEFWDFLHSRKDRNECLSREEERHQKPIFWDFLGPSSNKDQNGLSSEYIDSAVATSNDSGIHFENESQLSSKIKTNVGKTVSNGINLQSPELKSTSSDDEFWDFLSCNSPVVTFKELLKNYNFTNDDKESSISSFVSRCDESPFPSVSEYMELEGCSTLNSSPSSVSVRTKHYLGSENGTKEFNSRQSSNTKNCDKLKKTVESIDYTSYIDVLKYLQQECIVSDREVNLSSISNDNTCFYGNSSKINIKESEKYQGSLDRSDDLGKINEKHGKMQELNQGSSNKSQLNVSSTSQNHVYDGTAPILSLKYNSGESRKDGNSNEVNSFKLNSQQRGRIQQLINKRPTKRFKKNIPNLSVASHNTTVNSKPALTNSHLNAVNVVNFNQSNMQESLQNLKSINSYNTEHGIKSITTSRVNPLGINATVTQSTTSAIGVSVNNTTTSNTSTTSTPLYLLMPTNSATLQNPNYSHFFLVINNNGNAQMNQPTFIQNSGVAMNTNNLKSTPIQFGQVLQSKVNSEIGNKSDNVKQNVLIVNQSNKAESSSSASAAKSTLSNIKYQTIPQVYLPYTSLINSAAGTSQVNVQYLNKIPAVHSTVNIPVSVNNLVSSSEVPSTISNVIFSSAPITNCYSTVKSSGVAEQMTNLKLDLKHKAVQSKCRQPSLTPLKNIPLGNNKYAIQQISTPVQICSSEELNNSLGYSNFNKINESTFLEKAFVENKLAPRINASEALVNNVSSFQDTLSTIPHKSAILQQNENCQSIHFTSTNVGTSLTPSVCLTGKNTNLQEKGQISAANSINVNVVPVSGSLEINKNISTVNTIQMINTKDKQNASSISLNTANNLVPIKLGNSQNKSLATLQELFPPPISMVPVCVLPQTQDTKQSNTSKVLILNGNRKAQTVTHKLKIDPIPNRERSISKKAKEKLKKGRLKTVRELLQERRKSGSSHARGSNKMGKEIRVLRPVLRLSTCDVCPSKPSPIITNIPKLNAAVTSNNNEASADTRKRPNILLLPSSSKTIKKSSFTEDKQSSLEKEQESQCFADSSVSENVEVDSAKSSSMAFLGKARKEVIILARELGEEVTPDLKIIDLRNLIVASTNYEMVFVKELLNTVISQRTEEAEQRKREIESEETRKREEREFEMEKLKLQNESFNSAGSGSFRPNIDFLYMIPKFDLINNDIGLYLILFECQAQATDVPKEFWASHLLSLLPYEIVQLLAREDVGISRDFEKLRSLLLKRYKLTAEKFRQLFSKHCKSPTATWKDFASEVRNYFHGWISGLDISTFDQLKKLIIVDQIKRRVPPEVREHYIDEWSQLNNVEKLTSKLDDYDAVRTKRDFHTSTPEEELKTEHTLLLTRRGIQNRIRNSRRNISLRKSINFDMLCLWKARIHKSQVSFVYTQREVQSQ